jgi:hypothetical protein
MRRGRESQQADEAPTINIDIDIDIDIDNPHLR